ncbi:GtrA family protein [Candidatus Berkelbacteria bacterium]|nr:GtrA family protein [Candidatus Berkelbacteria bacterium]
MIHLIKFGLIGILNSAVGYLVIFGAMALADVAPAPANALGYAVGLIVSFGLNRTWNFRSQNAVGHEIGPFLTTFILAYAANLATLQAVLNAGVNPYLAQLAAGVVYLTVSFVLYKLWVFRPRHISRS